MLFHPLEAFDSVSNCDLKLCHLFYITNFGFVSFSTSDGVYVLESIQSKYLGELERYDINAWQQIFKNVCIVLMIYVYSFPSDCSALQMNFYDLVNF